MIRAFFLGLIFCSLVITSTRAQQALAVNGQVVSGLTTSLIEGSSYIPAASLAQALGAHYGFDTQARVVTFDYAARYISLHVYDSVAEAASDTQALTADGQALNSTAAVNVNGTVYVPVKPLIAALGGALYYSEELQKVIVTFPRAILRSAYVQPSAQYDRLVLDFEGRTPYQLYLNPALNTLQVRFQHLEPVTPQAFVGTLFSQAILQQVGGYADLVLPLNPNVRFESYTSSSPTGFSLVIDLFAGEAVPSEVSTVVIDPGHGGEDSGLAMNDSNEATLALSVAQSLESILNQKGIVSRLTRTDNVTLSIDERSQQGIGASLYLSIHTAELSPGQINIYYLSEAQNSAGLELAIQRNARLALDSEATNSLRRRLLLRYVPDLEKGEIYAKSIAETLRQNPGYTVSNMAGLPLSVLEGSAGRGVLIEFSATDLANPQLSSFLASALMTALLPQ
jgi:N-acetylmuramoyl-L-alanine amidase